MTKTTIKLIARLLIYLVMFSSAAISYADDVGRTKSKTILYMYTPRFHHVDLDNYPTDAIATQVNNTNEKTLYTGTFVKYVLEPGEHKITISSKEESSFFNTKYWKPVSFTIKIDSEKSKYLRIYASLARDQWLPIIKFVNKEIADYEFAQFESYDKIEAVVLNKKNN
jgi:hypothetical protein